MKDLNERLLKNDHLIHIDTEKLKNIFVVFYASTNDALLYDGTGLNAQQRREFVNQLIKEVQQGSNYDREIIATTGNVYFVY